MPFSPADESVELDQPCPIRDVLNRIGDQWSLLVLETLSGGTMRFNELGRAIGDVSKQMLSRTLKRLEQDGRQSHAVRRSAAACRICADRPRALFPDADAGDDPVGRRTSSRDLRCATSCAEMEGGGR